MHVDGDSTFYGIIRQLFSSDQDTEIWFQVEWMETRPKRLPFDPNLTYSMSKHLILSHVEKLPQPVSCIRGKVTVAGLDTSNRLVHPLVPHPQHPAEGMDRPAGFKSELEKPSPSEKDLNQDKEKPRMRGRPSKSSEAGGLVQTQLTATTNLTRNGNPVHLSQRAPGASVLHSQHIPSQRDLQAALPASLQASFQASLRGSAQGRPGGPGPTDTTLFEIPLHVISSFEPRLTAQAVEDAVFAPKKKKGRPFSVPRDGAVEIVPGLGDDFQPLVAPPNPAGRVVLSRKTKRNEKDHWLVHHVDGFRFEQYFPDNLGLGAPPPFARASVNAAPL